MERRPIVGECVFGETAAWCAKLVQCGDAVAGTEVDDSAADGVDDAGNVVPRVGEGRDCFEDAGGLFPVLDWVSNGSRNSDKSDM